MLADDPEVDVPDVVLAARIVVTTIESQVHRSIARTPGAVDEGALTDELVRMLVGYREVGPRTPQPSGPPVAISSSTWEFICALGATRRSGSGRSRSPGALGVQLAAAHRRLELQAERVVEAAAHEHADQEQAPPIPERVRPSRVHTPRRRGAPR